MPQDLDPLVKSPAAEYGRTVLLAEDDEQVRNLLHTFLANQGYRVLSAGDADEAEALAEKSGGDIDLLVTDVIMPRRSGPELHGSLARRWPAIKVVFVSGYFKEDSPQVQKVPEDAPLLQKPFSLNDLGSSIREVLAE